MVFFALLQTNKDGEVRLGTLGDADIIQFQLLGKNYWGLLEMLNTISTITVPTLQIQMAFVSCSL